MATANESGGGTGVSADLASGAGLLAAHSYLPLHCHAYGAGGCIPSSGTWIWMQSTRRAGDGWLGFDYEFCHGVIAGEEEYRDGDNG